MAFKAPPRQHYVYVISDGAGQCKIGKTINPKARLQNIITNSGNKSLEVRYTLLCASAQICRYTERRAHGALSHVRAHGEWFDVEIEQAIETIEYSHSIAVSHIKQMERLFGK